MHGQGKDRDCHGLLREHRLHPAIERLLVPFKMVAVGKGDYMYGGGQWWAEPDHDAAVSAMRRAAANATDIQSLAVCAREDIMRNYSFAAIGRTVKAAWAETLAPFPG
jgi:hypothetical protein